MTREMAKSRVRKRSRARKTPKKLKKTVKRRVKKGKQSARRVRRKPRVSGHLALLRQIQMAHVSKLPGLLSNMNSHQIHAICECVYNVLHTDLGVPPKKLEGLKKTMLKNKVDYHYLADPKKSVNQKKIILVQRGTGVKQLLGTIMPIIISLFV